MSVCSSPHCEYPTMSDSFICKICQQQLSRDLGDIPALIDDLNTTLARMDKLGSSGGRRGGESALPFKSPASEALYVIQHTVTGWVRVLHEDTGRHNHLIPGTDGFTVVGARWLLRYAHSIAMHPAAGEAVDEIASAVKKAYEVIDRAPDLLLAGQCGHEGCVEFLYAKPESQWVTCRGCGAEHSVDERRAWMTAGASDLHLPAVMCLSWVKLLMGKTIPRGTWDGWVYKSGRIAAASADHLGTPLYRFGDVQIAAAEWVARPRKGQAA